VTAKRVQQLVEGFGSYSTAANSLDSALSGGGVKALAGSAGPSMASRVEKAADQVFDLLITEESSPLQAIVLEQLARLLNAGVRGSWKNLRDRSGRLANGRSVLGTLVDPLGIFAKSDLVALDETDNRALAASQTLIEILQVPLLLPCFCTTHNGGAHVHVRRARISASDNVFVGNAPRTCAH
jgi:hypothetical protein